MALPEASPRKPHLNSVQPAAALPGGEVRLRGDQLGAADHRLPDVQFKDLSGFIVLSSPTLLQARVPDGALSGPLRVRAAGCDPSREEFSNPLPFAVAVAVTDNLHPVGNPALDPEGNVFVTFSGSRGQKPPITLFRIDTRYNLKPFSDAITNPTGLAFDRSGTLFVTSRHDGSVFRVAPNGTAAVYAEGLGVATGLAFDREENLYVGDRSGTIFKIDRTGNTFVFATIEPSVAAYHLAFGPDGELYVTGPTTSSYDAVWRINPAGEVRAFFRGLGRPQGIAFDVEGNLMVAGAWQGRRGIVRITPGAQAELVVSGTNLVGLAFSPTGLFLTTTTSLYHLEWPVPGLPLLP